MTACKKQEDRLLDYALGALPAAAAGEMETHLAACAGCAAALVEWRGRRERLDAALGTLVRGAEPPPAFRARVVAAAETAAAKRWTQPAWAGALAAVAVVALAGALLERPAVAPRPPVSLSEWRSPTDWLLRTPGDALLRTTPRLGEFYFPLPPAEAESNKGGNNEG